MRTKAAPALTFRYGIAALLAASVLSVGCGAEGGPGPTPPPTVGAPTPPPSAPVPPPSETPPPPVPEQPQPARTAQVAGTYQLTSSLDLSPALPQTVVDVVNAIHDIADDPAGFILDQAISKLPDGFVKTALQAGKSLAAPLIDQWITDHSPSFVDDIRNIAVAVGDAMNNLQFGSKLDLTGDSGAMSSSHYIESFMFDYAGDKLTLSVTDLGEQSVASAEGFSSTVSGTDLAVGQHALSFNYGQVIIGAVNKLIIPRLSPGATSLGELLTAKIDCSAIADTIHNAVSLVPADIASGACSLGLQAGAGFIESKIEGLAFDSNAIQLQGTGTIVDQNGDLTYDQISNGLWTATISIGGNTSTLTGSSDAFTGSR
jgi:hypothetical protein